MCICMQLISSGRTYKKILVTFREAVGKSFHSIAFCSFFSFLSFFFNLDEKNPYRNTKSECQLDSCREKRDELCYNKPVLESIFVALRMYP